MSSKKLSCFNPFLPWHELQVPQLPPPQRSCTRQHVLILLTEEKHLISYCCPDHNILWELYTKENLLQCVIHMLFLWPNSGNRIPQACFQKHSCVFPGKTHIHHPSTELILSSMLHCVNWLLFPSFLPQQDAKLSALSPSQELALSLLTICP